MSIIDRLKARRAESEQPPEPPNTVAKSDSGRAHSSGFLQLEEHNSDLMHPYGHAVYDKMYRGDADVRQVVQLCVNPIAGGTWEVEPGGGTDSSDLDKKCAEALEQNVFHLMDPDLLGHLMEFLPVLFRSGFAPGEIVWRPEKLDAATDRLLIVDTVQLRLPRTVQRWYQLRGRLEGIQQQLSGWKVDSLPSQGKNAAIALNANLQNHLGLVDIPRKDLLYYRVGAEGDNWEGVSLLRAAYKHWYIKDGVEKMDAVAQEREALGVAFVYPPPGASDSQLDDVAGAVESMRAGDVSFVVMPGMKAGQGAPEGTGWFVELMGFDRAGSGRDPMPMLAYHSAKIAAAFIADFMKLGHGTSGARATAQVQADPFLASVEALVGPLEKELNRQISKPFRDYNFPGAKVPKITMSLVDQTSLSALADFVLKLTQVGALMPDQQLEDFLRKRADLPAADSVAVDDRAKQDGELRRAVVGATEAPLPGADPFGSNAPAGAHKGGKPAGGGLKRGAAKATGAAKGPAGAGGGAPRAAGKEMSVGEDVRREFSLAEAVTLSAFEETVDLDQLDDDMTMSGDAMASALGDHVLAIARGGLSDHRTMSLAAAEVLGTRYRLGREHVAREMGHEIDATTLGHSMGDTTASLSRRAALSARRVIHATEGARDSAELDHGPGPYAQAAAEKAGRRAATRQGLVHGIAAIQHGRHDEILDNGDGVGVVYSAILDRGTCHECSEAHDGVVRALDDPVRLDRRPPNRHCESTASGDNLCRCIEIPSPLG